MRLFDFAVCDACMEEGRGALTLSHGLPKILDYQKEKKREALKKM